MEDELLDYSKKEYNKVFKKTYNDLLANAQKRFGKITDSQIGEFEKVAQLEAIKVTRKKIVSKQYSFAVG